MSVRRLAAVAAMLLTTLAPLTLVAAAPSSALTGVPGYVTMVSETGDFVGGGVARTYRDNLTVSGDSGFVVVSAGPYRLEFAAPAGEYLVPGHYPGATRYPFQEAGAPGLDVSGDGRGCNELTGWFTILDLGPDRLWIAYEQHCEGGDAALFGEIRLGYGEGSAPLGVEAGIIAFPSDYPGVAVRPVPVRVANHSSATARVTSAVAAGSADFSILSNGCTAALAPGAACTVYVGWTPTRPGARLGLLVISDDRGNVREISLSGVGTPGRTRWQMSGDPGDYISGGRSYLYTPQTGARLRGGGTETYAWMRAEHADDWWNASFQAPQGQILLPGKTYTGATRHPFNSGNAGLDVSGSGRGCNTLTGQFTVHEATYDNGDLTSFRISFEQHCEGGAAALRGEVAWRAVDPDAPTPDTAVPAPVSDLVAQAAGGSVQLTWHNPTDPDWVDTVVIGTPGTQPATMGHLFYDGRREGVTISGLPTSAPFTLTVFTEDTSGNLSPLRSVTFPAGTSSPAPAAPVPAPAPAPAPPPGTTTPHVRKVDLAAQRLTRARYRFVARAGRWAAGDRGVLLRRTSRGWRRVGRAKFSDRGRMRLTERVPRGRSRYRVVVRVEGERIVSPAIRVRRRR